MVLVVEDDPMVAEMTSRLLKDAGYQSECIGTGKQALAMVENKAVTVDALLIDLTLPDMPGLEVARQARLKRPSLPVVLTSGYPRYREVPPEFDGAPFLAKPYSLDELVTAVQRLLPSEARG
jgi:CheY-like chemotaxis protein